MGFATFCFNCYIYNAKKGTVVQYHESKVYTRQHPDFLCFFQGAENTYMPSSLHVYCKNYVN